MTRLAYTCLCLSFFTYVIGSPTNVLTGSNSILDAPYFVSIEVDGKYLCGGSILDDSYIITSQSCVGSLNVNKTEVYIRAGTDRLSFRGQDLRVISITNDKGSDLSLVQTATDFKFNNQVWWTNPNNEGIKTGIQGVVSAWANKETVKSPLVVAPVVSMAHDDCVTALSGVYNITEGQACLQPTVSSSKSCLADLGSPFYLNEQLYGVVSYAGGCSSSLPLVVTPISINTKFIISTFCDMSSLVG